MLEYSLYISVGSIILSLIVVTSFIYSHYQKVLQKNAYIDGLEQELHALEKSITETTDLLTLEPLLKKELSKIFHTKIATLEMYREWENPDFFPLIREYFQHFHGEWVFENTEVFLREIEDDLLRDALERLIPKDIALIFPIYSTSWFHIGNLILWEKWTTDEYIPDEIEFLKEFTFFVEIHLKYIRTYSLMHEFSKMLDERIDNKTIAYNNLVNRQKEFIQMISHEVRSPMTSAIFQVESAIENLEWKNFIKDITLMELKELRTQLVRTWWLISKLFSVEYYDNHEVTLFREAIHFPKFLEYEIELFSRIHEEITFLSHVDPNIWFIAIDKVQFQQVITNLLDNAIKFAAKEDPLIYLSASISDHKLILTVEDNGKGFSDASMKVIFEKYNTRSNKNVWLGLGLYLCRKIIMLHNGTIIASNSELYKWARFTITLPLTEEN